MLTPSVATVDPFAQLLGKVHPPRIDHDMVTARPIQLSQLPHATQRAICDLVDDGPPIPKLDDPTQVEPWSEYAIVRLHLVLLQQLDRLEDPSTPLEEKLDTLAWVFTEPSKDDRPFSFVQCVRVVGLSPLSESAYYGKVDIDELRSLIDFRAKRWLRATIERYPPWVRQIIRTQPDFVISELVANPQWINEQIKAAAATSQGDLFGHPVEAISERERTDA